MLHVLLRNQPIGRTPALSVTYSAAEAAVCGMWHYISDGDRKEGVGDADVGK